VRRAWKDLLQNHPHDSICGCSIDEVHRDMVPRFAGVIETSEQLLRRQLERLAPTFARRAADDRATVLCVANPQPRVRTQVVERLIVLQPFGDLPQLFADLRIFALDMKQLTDTFSFGRITGSLEGEVLGLHMINWHPVAFDAWLATPADDPRRHRISQRAVENLASVSGGPSAVLSSGVMALFDDFAYGRLGLRCRLENGVCVMGGVEDAENGYYIVRGKWLPRIDVIGHRSRVDWERLVAQLKSIAASGEVTVR